MNADEILDKANPCGCGGQKSQLSYHAKKGDHVIRCFNCDLYVASNQVDRMLDHWNYRNPLPEPIKDHAWQQATELAQAGSNDKTFGQAQDELLAKITDQKQLAFNALCAMFVKKTADELPDPQADVFIWVDNKWLLGHLGLYGDWYDYHDNYWQQSEVKYWLPLPSFNPE